MMRILCLLAIATQREILQWLTGRAFVITLMINQAVAPLIGLAVWSVALPGNSQISTYYVALLAIQLMTVSYENHTFSNAIYDGTFSQELLKPQPTVLGQLGTNIAMRLWHLLFGLPIIILAGVITHTTWDVHMLNEKLETGENFLMLEPDLLVTKFTVPPVRSGLLQRSHLLTLLEQSPQVPLTLLSASAGFGMTTLLSAWASQSQYREQIAWLTLEEQDNDPMRFWAYVIAALRKAGAPVGAPTEALLHSSQSSLLTGAITSLINELAALEQDIALILDDYHVIREQALHASLQFMLEHLPPNLHLFAY
ncbi:hypothetical protein KSC_092790 [Ktedonobacter sp. SOSP1-52]|uniref:hypothetical protein n=1 Tax=Ktedonobacter sp. SOSP1-52 TaxID=2778366 RepID=UPI001915A711|nr:hypothetical protein [Ktedonobacter sp. SOSP1-52]GHO70387.1 hypothetical protein KSC_092790 [Ktedonobacter sp. SOSP1-52]